MTTSPTPNTGILWADDAHIGFGPVHRTAQDLWDELTWGYLSKAITGNTVLTFTDGVSSEARHRLIEFTGALVADATLTFPAKQGRWVVKNSTTGGFNLILTVGGGATVSVPPAEYRHVVSEATNMFQVIGIGKQSIWIPAKEMHPTVTAGCAALATVEIGAGQPTVQVLDFDSGANEHAQFNFKLPKRWDLATVSFRAHWMHAGGQAGGLDGVAWGLQGAVVSDADSLAVSFGTAVNVAEDGVAATTLFISAESGAVTLAGTPTDGDSVFLQVLRDTADAGDDLDIDARLLGIELFYFANKETDG